jgi:hypothetical protein
VLLVTSCLGSRVFVNAPLGMEAVDHAQHGLHPMSIDSQAMQRDTMMVSLTWGASHHKAY